MFSAFSRTAILVAVVFAFIHAGCHESPGQANGTNPSSASSQPRPIRIDRFLSRVAVQSIGGVDGSATVWVDEAPIVGSADAPAGLRVVAVQDSTVVLTDVFSVTASSEQADRFAAAIDGLDHGAFVVLAVSGSSGSSSSQKVADAITAVGGIRGVRDLPDHASYFLVGAKGLPAGDALEAWSATASVLYPKEVLPDNPGVNLRATIRGHAGKPAISKVSGDNARIATCGADRSVKVWNLADGKLVLAIRTESLPVRVDLSPNSNLVAATFEASGVINVWDANDGRLVAQGNVTEGEINDIEFTSDSTQLVLCDTLGAIRSVDVKTGEQVMSIQAPAECTRIALSPDGSLIAVCAHQTLAVYERETGTPRWSQQADSRQVLTVGFAPDGKRLLTGQADHNIYSWDVENGGQRLGRVGRDSTWVYAAPSPDGGSYASWSAHALKVKLWDLEARAVRHTFTAHRGRITDVTFSPNGATLVTAGVDGAVKIWDIAALLDN